MGRNRSAKSGSDTTAFVAAVETGGALSQRDRDTPVCLLNQRGGLPVIRPGQVVWPGVPQHSGEVSGRFKETVLSRSWRRRGRVVERGGLENR